jgi:hypothetical protein
MGTSVGNLGERGIAVARGPGIEAFVFQNSGNEVANIGFIIDNQNVTGHGLHLSCQLPDAALNFVSSLVADAVALVSTADAFV